MEAAKCGFLQLNAGNYLAPPSMPAPQLAKKRIPLKEAADFQDATLIRLRAQRFGLA
jgi:hypothetical protein